MDYGRIFTRAWGICWHNKYLFFLGFLAALGSGASSSGPQLNYSFTGDELPPGWEQNLERLVDNFVPILILGSCVVLLLGLALWLLRLVAQGGMIYAAAELDAGEKISMGQAFSAGGRYLWRLLGINILLYGPFLIAVLVGVGGFIAAIVAWLVPVSTTTTPTPDEVGPVGAAVGFIFCCLGLLVCLLVPLWLLITVIYPFAQRGAVLQGLGVVESIRHGWQVVRANVGDVILLVVFFIVLAIVAGIVLTLVLLPLGFLALGPSLFDVFGTQTVGTGDILWLILGGLLVALIGAIINSVLIAYRSVTVTLAYEEFVARMKPVS